MDQDELSWKVNLGGELNESEVELNKLGAESNVLVGEVNKPEGESNSSGGGAEGSGVTRWYKVAKKFASHYSNVQYCKTGYWYNTKSTAPPCG